MEEYKKPDDLGYENNKDIRFNRINNIHITKFRTMEDRWLKLGSNITIISGKNGTLKSTILGLIAHPFSSPNDAKDIFGHPLKTKMSDVFRLSLDKDTVKYQYEIQATTDKNENLMETVMVYPRPNDGKGRHRISVGTQNRIGDGNFALNTAYLNLKRLFPIIDTSADIDNEVILTDDEKSKITTAYLKVMTRNAFAEFDCVSDFKTKNTLGPKNAIYDFNTISSGEDNLGNILIKMLAFERNKTGEDCLQGILCIDEIEASLHPVALTNLFDYMLEWSERNKVQIVLTTHSLYLINHILVIQSKTDINKEKICLNIISTAHVGNDLNYRIISNPSYVDTYKELTLKSLEEPPYKVNILCEDAMAGSLIKDIFGKKKLSKGVNIITDVAGPTQTGTSCSGLLSLGKNGAALLEDSIIILDPDVEETLINSVKRKGVSIFLLPDVFKENKKKGWPIEKSVCKFILSTPGNSKIFKEEKMHYVNILHDYGILENTIDEDEKVSKYKNWQKANYKDYYSFLAAYVRENNVFSEFYKEILEAVNHKRTRRGLNKIEL